MAPVAEGGDLALPALIDRLPEGRAPLDGMLSAVELLLPDGAAQVVVSPLVVASVVIDAMFLTGRSISVPAAAAGVVTALLVIGVGSQSPRRLRFALRD